MQTLRDLWAGIWLRIVAEPVMTQALVQAFLAMLVGFGLPVTTQQMALMWAFSAALLGWVARQRVTPVDA